MEPLKLINALRETDYNIQHIFMMGSCYRFHLFIKTIFPEATPYMHADRDHVVSKIRGKMYDIRGEIPEKYESLYSPLDDEDLEMVERWSFARQMAISLGECPNCDEPICV